MKKAAGFISAAFFMWLKTGQESKGARGRNDLRPVRSDADRPPEAEM